MDRTFPRSHRSSCPLHSIDRCTRAAVVTRSANSNNAEGPGFKAACTARQICLPHSSSSSEMFSCSIYHSQPHHASIETRKTAERRAAANRSSTASHQESLVATPTAIVHRLKSQRSSKSDGAAAARRGLRSQHAGPGGQAAAGVDAGIGGLGRRRGGTWVAGPLFFFWGERAAFLVVDWSFHRDTPHSAIDRPIPNSTPPDQRLQRLGAEQQSHAHGRATTAGNELYLLASNFLLYTALVIVAIMISKLYLEAEPNASPRCVLLGVGHGPDERLSWRQTHASAFPCVCPHHSNPQPTQQLPCPALLEPRRPGALRRLGVLGEAQGRPVHAGLQPDAGVWWCGMDVYLHSPRPPSTSAFSAASTMYHTHTHVQNQNRRCSPRGRVRRSGSPRGCGARPTCCAPWPFAPRGSSPPSSSGASSRSACSPCPTGQHRSVRPSPLLSPATSRNQPNHQPLKSLKTPNIYRDGEYFTYSYGLVCTNRLFSLILSSVLVWVFERESITLSTVRPPRPFLSLFLSPACISGVHARRARRARLTYTPTIPQTAGAALRVQLSLRLQHALLLVSVRGPLLRDLPHAGP